MEQPENQISTFSSDVFGGDMTLEEVRAAFGGNDKQGIRAMGKLSLFLREQSLYDATNSAAAGLPGNRDFNLGSANAHAIMAQHLALLMQGTFGDSLSEIFKDRSQPASESKE